MSPLIKREQDLNVIYESEQDCSSEAPFTENIRKLWIEKFGCDTFLAVGEERKIFAAHRLVLSSGSKFFQEMFADPSHLGGNEYSPIEFPDMSPETIQTVLNFLYSEQRCSSVRIPSSSALHVLYAANKFRMPALKLACKMHLKHMSAKDSIYILQQAIPLNENIIVQKCLRIADDHPEEVLSSEGLLDCSHATLRLLINRDTFIPHEHFRFFMSLLSWSIAECQRQNLDVTPLNQRQALGELITFVKFELLTNQELADVARTGVLTSQEMVMYASGQYPKISSENPFEPADEIVEEERTESADQESSSIQQIPSIVPWGFAASLRGMFDGNERLDPHMQQFSSDTANDNNKIFSFTVDHDIELFGFSIFGFCDGNNDVIRRTLQIPVSLPERVEVDVTLLQHLIRFTLKHGKHIKANKKYSLEVKLEHVSNERPRFEGFGDVKPEVKLENGETIRFTFELDRNVAELYFGTERRRRQTVDENENESELFRKISTSSASSVLMGRTQRWNSIY
ncbi:unnamed protein product [Anisakis simplex]|uniref:BTB domain-containing protein n=1 Tax=Anisakis simplex TaxID=6269 RepID=A0A158PMS0_ANISI|nr:unnamed protein product [Anisakis simplex]